MDADGSNVDIADASNDSSPAVTPTSSAVNSSSSKPILGCNIDGWINLLALDDEISCVENFDADTADFSHTFLPTVAQDLGADSSTMPAFAGLAAATVALQLPLASFADDHIDELVPDEGELDDIFEDGEMSASVNGAELPSWLDDSCMPGSTDAEMDA